MEKEAAASEILNLLNQALARELQVSVQYMIQHSVAAGQWNGVSSQAADVRLNKFMASHSSYFLPGPTLKKIAIAEMRHAEAIAERVVHLGGKPTTQPGNITLDSTTKMMLENDRELEQGAIELYKHIIDVAEKNQDPVTKSLFQSILSDEEKHHKKFSELLGMD